MSIRQAFCLTLSCLPLMTGLAWGSPRAEGYRAAVYQQVALAGIQQRQSKASSAAEAAAIAKQRYGGKILKVEAINTKDGQRYRVRILLDDGRVKTVII